METLHCINTRRSVRKYQDIPVELEKVGRIIEAGFATPTAGNVQDLRFVMIFAEDGRKKLAEASLQQYWMEQAPVHILLCTDIKRSKQFYGIRGERLYAIQHSGAAAMNMINAAHDLGLGACWVGAFDEEMVKVAMGIPDYARPQAIITVGYADEHPPKPPKFIMETYTYTEKYNNRLKNFPVAITEWSPVVEDTVKTGIKTTHKYGNMFIEKVIEWFKEQFKGKKKE